MKSVEDILNLSKKYLNGHANMNLRFKRWREVAYPIVKNTLYNITRELTAQNEYFKNNLYVVDGNPDVGIYLKSGKVIVPVPGENFYEEGFQIHFSQVSNGTINVFIKEHAIEKEGNYFAIALIDDPLKLTEEYVIELVYNGLEMVYKTSFLYAGDSSLV